MDEVSGRILQADASAHDATYCQPCFQDGEILPSEAYCTVCKEFMCVNCTKVHGRLRISKSHTLLDKCSMPTTMRGFAITEESTEPCDIHPGEFIKYFCPTHQTLNCGHCTNLDHESCKQQIISKIAKAFKGGQDYEAIIQVPVQLLNDIDACASNIEDSIKLVNDLEEREMSKLKEYRDMVNKYFDEREKALLKTIARIKNIDETLLDYLKPKCVNLKSQVKEIKAKLEIQENNASHLFIKAQRARNMLEGLQSTLIEIKNQKKNVHQYWFMKNPVIDRLLASKTGLGSVKETVQRWERTKSTAKSDAATRVQAVGDIQTAQNNQEGLRQYKSNRAIFKS